MLTLEYKNIKQYVIVNIVILLIYIGILCLAINVFGLPQSMLFSNISREGIITYDFWIELYLIFLTCNAIKNKKKLLIFNAIVLDLITLLYVFVWHETFFGESFVAYLPILLIEGIILLIRKYKNEKQDKQNKANM